jgi:hypothetical protein
MFIIDGKAGGPLRAIAKMLDTGNGLFPRPLQSAKLQHLTPEGLSD